MECKVSSEGEHPAHNRDLIETLWNVKVVSDAWSMISSAI